MCTWADLTAVIGFHPNLKPLQRHKGLGLRIPGPLVVEEAESGGDVSYAEVVCCLLDLGGAAGAAGLDDVGLCPR